MNEQKEQRLKPLLDKLPPGFLVESAWLKAQGIARSSAHDYVQRGWLEKVTRGLYRRPFTQDTHENLRTGWLIPTLSMQHLLSYDMHVGGGTALNEHGHVHYLRTAATEKVYLYGDTPTWLNRLPGNAIYVRRSRKLFEEEMLGVQNADDDNTPDQNTLSVPKSWLLKLSSPERALFEALDELPDEESFHNLDMVFEGLVNLRPKLLTQCLKSCKSIKVKRLFLVFADKHNHAWLKYIDKSDVDLGSGPRALVKGGKFHPEYHISVPEEFLPAASPEERQNV